MAQTVHTRQLDNGLTVVVEENHAVPLVAVNLWYDVGSRDESDGRRGIAHLFEHLMFQGSGNVPSGHHAQILESLGARFNATTSFERTNYFETVPARALALALWLEADRMGTLADGLTQREVDAQRDVVKNENLQTIVNVPYGRAFEYLLERVYPAGHPLAIGPIGRMEDLDAASIDDLRAFFHLHYAPGNAVLTIVGDVLAQNAFESAELYFSGIPSGEIPKKIATEPLGPLDAPVDFATDSEVPSTGIFVGWRGPSLHDSSIDALSVAAAILGAGVNSRIRSRLVRDSGLAVDIGFSVLPLPGNSFANAHVILAEHAEAAEALRLVHQEIESLATSGPSLDEFEAARAGIERDLIESSMTLGGRADELSRYATLFGDPARADTALDRLRAVTPADVVDAVANWLSADSAVTVMIHPAAVTSEAPSDIPVDVESALALGKA